MLEFGTREYVRELSFIYVCLLIKPLVEVRLLSCIRLFGHYRLVYAHHQRHITSVPATTRIEPLSHLHVYDLVSCLLYLSVH